MKFSKKVRETIDKCGFKDNIFVYPQSTFTRIGVFDYIGEVNGKFYAIDSKDLRDRLTNTQMDWFLNLSDKATFMVVHNGWSERVIANQLEKIEVRKNFLMNVKKRTNLPDIQFLDLKTFERHLRFEKSRNSIKR